MASDGINMTNLCFSRTFTIVRCDFGAPVIFRQRDRHGAPDATRRSGYQSHSIG